MKRFLSVLLIVFLMFASGSAFADATDALYETLADYVLYYDRVLEDEIWAYGYVEAFYNDRTYDKLNIARTAVTSAIYEITNMEPPVYNISQTDTVELMLAGVEADALLLTMEGIEILREEKVIRLQSVSDALLTTVYYEPALENLMKKIACYRQDVQLDAKSTVHFFNYLLIESGREKEAGDLWNYMSGNTKVISGQMDAYLPDTLLIAEEEALLLDKVSENGGEIEVLSGFSDVYFLLMDEAAETGNYDLFIKGSTEIKGEYETFPGAWWMDPLMGEYQYIFSKSDTGELYIHSMGNEIETAPDRIKMTFYGVEGTDAVDYIRTLYSCGLVPQYELTEEEGVQKLYIMVYAGESCLMVIWSEAETLVYLSPPLAMLVPLMFYDAY